MIFIKTFESFVNENKSAILESGKLWSILAKHGAYAAKMFIATLITAGLSFLTIYIVAKIAKVTPKDKQKKFDKIVLEHFTLAQFDTLVTDLKEDEIMAELLNEYNFYLGKMLHAEYEYKKNSGEDYHSFTSQELTNNKLETFKITKKLYALEKRIDKRKKEILTSKDYNKIKKIESQVKTIYK